MKLWLIERKNEDNSWDEYSAHIIAAETKEDVITMAKEKGKDTEESGTWDTATVTLIGDALMQKQKIILSDFWEA